MLNWILTKAKTLCETHEDGSYRLRNYPAILGMTLISWKAEDENGELCLCCMGIRALALMLMSLVIGFGIGLLVP